MNHIEMYMRTVLAGTALAVVKSIHELLIVVFLLTLINWLVGIRSDISVGKKYSHKKTLKAIKESYTAVAVLFFTGVVCQLMAPDVDYTNLIRGIALVFAVIYAKNISRNLRVLQPRNEFVGFLNALLTMKYLKLLKKVDKEEDVDLKKPFE